LVAPKHSLTNNERAGKRVNRSVGKAIGAKNEIFDLDQREQRAMMRMRHARAGMAVRPESVRAAIVQERQAGGHDGEA